MGGVAGGMSGDEPTVARWPLHVIVITNMLRCMQYKREVERGSCIAQ